MAEQIPNRPVTSPSASDGHAVDDLHDGRPHAPADDHETIYFEGSPLLRGEAGRFIVFALLAAVCIAIPILLRNFKPELTIPWWGWLICGLLALVFLFIPLLIVKAVRYRISNYRIDYERGILGKKIDTLELWHVEDISFKQSFLGRILNVGTVVVISHDDTTPELQLEGLPNPRQIFESLKQRVIAVKRQRGVVKMDIG